MNYIFEYLVLDERYHEMGLDAGAAFGTNDLEEAKRAANEIGFNSVVVQHDIETGWCELVYDATDNGELPLRA